MENLNKKQKIIVYAIGIIVFILIGLYTWKKTEKIEYDNFENEIINDTSNIEENSLDTEENIEDMIVVHVIGAIKNPGIVRIKEGARIIDVVEAAGGSTETANLDRINLAYIVEDGQKIYIPSIEDQDNTINKEINEYITENAGNNVVMENTENKTNEKININTANQQELETLSGIGEAIAGRIIEYRETNGQFKSIEEIKNVNGIGDARYENIKDSICIK